MFGLCLLGLIGIWIWYFLVGNKPVDAPSHPSVITLSVLPFAGDVVLGGGLAVELARALDQVPGLRVLRGPGSDAVAVLKGTVDLRTPHPTVVAQLIDAKTNFQLWSQTYDFKNGLAFEDDLAKAVVNVLRVPIHVDSNHRFAPRLAVNWDLYIPYLSGRYWLIHDNPAEAVNYLERITRPSDPPFAAATAALANSYVKLHLWSKAAAAAQKAIAIDSSIAEAHVALGFVKAVNEWDWAGSEREFRRAMELCPSSADEHTSLAMAYLAPLGQLETARAESKLGAELDPFSAISQYAAGWILLVSRQYDAAVEPYQKVLDVHPDDFEASWELGMAYAYAGKPQLAVERFQKSGFVRDEVSELALTGHMDEARQKAGGIQKLSNTKAAQAYALIGDKDNAFAALDRAFVEHDQQLIWLKVDPRFDNLRSDARLRPMLKKIFGSE